ncbi:hypothetical protein SAMN05443579_1411 [Variovorax sp. PDC80]|nr:hypothetical protein SAMN05443579_1411 [Variovorax sp. PDC80]
MCDEATCALVPRVGALDHPALGLHDEALRDGVRPQLPLLSHEGACDAVGWMTNDLDRNAVRFSQRHCTLAGIGCIDVELLQSWRFSAGLRNHRGGAIAVLHARSGHGQSQQQSQGIDHEMALAAFDLLARIEATIATLGRAARALRVDDGGRRLGRFADALAPLLTQTIVHELERARLCPASKRRVHRTPRREVRRQEPPCAAGAHDVHAGIDDVATLVRAGRAASTVALEQIMHKGPLGIGEVRVHAVEATFPAMRCCIAKSLRRRPLGLRTLACAPCRPYALDSCLLEGLADRRRANLNSRLMHERARQLVHRCLRHLPSQLDKPEQFARLQQRWPAAQILALSRRRPHSSPPALQHCVWDEDNV